MADAQTAQLCVQIIHSHFGPLTASVASHLLSRGRLTLGQIVRYSNLKSRLVREALIVLVQHNLLWHAQTNEEGEVFEVNINECFMRLRFGKFVWLAEQLLGTEAAAVVQVVLDHGKLRPPDILSRIGIFEPKSILLYNRTIHTLVSKAYLKPSTALSHVSPTDRRIQYEAEEKKKISGFPTAKELREAKEVAEARLRREDFEAEKLGMKRSDNQSSRIPRKRKLAERMETVDESIYFRVNFDRFNTHIRNSLIVKAARERFNSGAALVTQAALKVTEEKQLTLSDIRSDPISVANVIMQLSENDDVSSGLVFPSKRVPKSVCVKDYLGMLSSADNPTSTGRAESFLSFTSSKIQVEFKIVARRLQRRVLEAVTREKHGKEGVRILRLLLDRGKLDEKQISKSVMMASKDVRPLLAALTADGLITTQEVPKSADRNPARMFYLWFVDLHKAYSSILGSLYKTLYNIGMRREAEKGTPENRAVLDKRERSDVSQDVSLLSRLERDILKGWEQKQERLTVLEMRVEEAVFVLKDLAVLGIEDD